MSSTALFITPSRKSRRRQTARAAGGDLVVGSVARFVDTPYLIAVHRRVVHRIRFKVVEEAGGRGEAVKVGAPGGALRQGDTDAGGAEAALGHAAPGAAKGPPADRLRVAAGVLGVSVPATWVAFFSRSRRRGRGPVLLLLVEQLVAALLQLREAVLEQPPSEDVPVDERPHHRRVITIVVVEDDLSQLKARKYKLV